MMTLQSLLLRQPVIRRMLGIPLVHEHMRQHVPSMMDSLRYARQWWNEKAADVKASQRR